jgi:hypothetical protein
MTKLQVKGDVSECLSLNFAETKLSYGDCQASMEFICKKPTAEEVLFLAGKGTKWLLFIIVLVLIVVAVAVIYFFSRKPKEGFVEPIPGSNDVSYSQRDETQQICVKTKQDFSPL